MKIRGRHAPVSLQAYVLYLKLVDSGDEARSRDLASFLRRVLVSEMSRACTLALPIAPHSSSQYLMHSSVLIAAIPQVFKHGPCLEPALTQGDLINGRHVILT